MVDEVESLKQNVEMLMQTIAEAKVAQEMKDKEELKTQTEIPKEVIIEKRQEDGLDEFLDAFGGEFGMNQQLIARTVLQFGLTLLRKNRNYGSSVFKQPVLTPDIGTDAAIRVRMSDKIERLITLFKGNKDLVGESVIDTISDLGAYCILWLVYKGRKG
jgi:hypothetical protein